MAYTQINRRIAITTPLGKDVLLLRGFTGSEAISHPFQFDLDLLSENDSIKFQDVVGKNVTVRLFDEKAKERHWNGFITRFSQGSRSDRLTEYHARMEPWLWFLTRKADCRIFQDLAVPDIIKKIFGELGFQDFQLKLYGAFDKRDYCVQYRETDFNFVSRLMEEEGICYYFEHADGKHTMILTNDQAGHKPCEVAVARYDTRPGSLAYEDTITEWRSQEEFRSGAWAQTDYNFETPSASLAVTVNGKNSYEIYDYPGEYMARGNGDRLARIRLQEQATPATVCQGSGGCRWFTSGFKFTLKEHYRADQNQEYLLTAVHHAATQGGDYEVGSGGGEGPTYHNSFECVPSSTTFRPARVTPQPIVQGCQTAVVVGPGGEEIYTDKYGRVKVQFFWDRLGKKDANSSCWMRVSHPWAGKEWGAIAIPRIGQEVIVGFLEGDPDQPIIVGRVYNAEQMPPWSLPANATQSGVLTRSSKGGSPANANALRFEDKKGSEQVWFHAEKNMDTEVEHDKTLWVGHDESCVVDHDLTRHVKHDETVTIDNNETRTVHANQTETVDKNVTITVHGQHYETIDKSMSVDVGLNLNETVAVNYSETVGGAMEVTVGGLMMISVGGVMTENVGAEKGESVGGNKSENIGANRTLEVGKDLSETIGQNQTLQVGKDLTETIEGKYQLAVTKELMVSAKKVEIVAEDEVAIKAGDAEIVLKKNGDITITGKKINIKGSGDVIIKGSKIEAN